MTGCYITERRQSDLFHLTRAIGGALARVSVGVVVVVKCVAATKQRLQCRCLQCPFVTCFTTIKPPTKLAINLKTAKAIGVDVPLRSLRADKLIE